METSQVTRITHCMQGALVRLCRRLFAIVLVLAAACYIPFRASASPSTGTSIHTAAHVAVATDTLSEIAPHNTIVPVAEPMVDTNAQLRGSVATTGGDDEPSSQENSSDSGYASTKLSKISFIRVSLFYRTLELVFYTLKNVT